MKLDDLKKSVIPTGYPLSAFSTIEPFASWYKKIFLKNGNNNKTFRPRPGKKTSPVQAPNPPSNTLKLPEWLDYVFLEDMKSNRIEKGIFKGHFEYTVDFSARKEVAILVSQPKDTVILFGRDKKAGEKSEYCRIHFILEPKYGTIIRLNISGNLRFLLSNSLVKPVVENNGHWIESAQKHVEVPLDDAVLKLGRGIAPRLSDTLRVPDVTVQIAGTTIVAKLSQVELGGTALKPKVRFLKTRLVYTNN